MSDQLNESLDYEDYEEMDGTANDDDEDEEDSSEDYEYTDDFCDDAHFDGFLKSNAEVDADLTHDQIMNYLRLGIDSKRSPGLAVELVGMANNGLKKQVADGIVEFVCTCPPSNVELVQRFQSIQAVVKLWEESGEYLTTAINDILDPEKPPLNRIPSRNLANFIRVLVDEKIIDKEKILISTTRDCSLPDPYLERLHQVLYNHYGCGNPKAPKSASSTFSNFFSNIIPTSSTATTNAATATNETSNQAPSSSNDLISPSEIVNIVTGAPATTEGESESQSTISSIMNSWKKIVTGSSSSNPGPSSS